MTRVFSFDAETDGLYGPVWAVGAAVLDTDANQMDVFAAQIDSDIVTDSWVREHIVPVVNLPQFDGREQLLHKFWEFWVAHRDDSLCVADFGAPVEAGLFRACVEQDLDSRMWKGPYPMHELGTALLLAGVDPDVNRREFAERTDLVQHNPLHDAIAAAFCWVKAREAIS